MNNENPVIRRPIRITRAHHTDLVCAAMNDTTGASQKILDRLEDIPPIVSLDAERTLDGTKVADVVGEMMMSDTYGEFKPTIVIDSCPPELFALQAQDPIPSEDGTLIDPDQKPKPSPSGLLMRLMSRL